MDIKEIVGRFSGVKVGVIGDIMLDRYIHGNVERISPEAPVPIVKKEKEYYGLGGAGNVAANIASLGGKSFLFGYIGKDNAGDIILKKLQEHGIQSGLLRTLEKTTEKTRIIGNDQQQIVRIDDEEYKGVSKRIEKILAERVFEKNCG